MDFRRDCLGIGMPDIPGCPATSLYVSQYQTVYDAFGSPPPASVASAQNTMVSDLVDAGVWAKFDCFWLFANYTDADSLINWITPGTYNCVKVETAGVLTWTQYEGYNGFGVTSERYLNTSWNPSTNGVNYTRNSASYGIYSRTNAIETSVDLGCYDGTRRSHSSTRYTGDLISTRVNCGAATTAANTNSTGMYVFSRTASNSVKGYKNKAVMTTNTTVSTDPPSANFYLLAFNSNGISASWSSRQYSMAFTGGGMTQTDVDNITDAVEAYMDSNGKGVIA